MPKGRCLCGAVRFDVTAPLSPPDACHCTRCRRASGHFWASTNVKRPDLAIEGLDHVRWYATSETVRRGFCDTCGSQLFWDPTDHDFIAVAMGAFDRPTDTHLHKHIYVANRGDYYDIADSVPQFEGS